VVACKQFAVEQRRQRSAIGCAINAAVEVLGDPWAMLVLRDVMFGDRRHFRELLAGCEEASRPTSSPAASSGSWRPGCSPATTLVVGNGRPTR
jgi:hypothetical protein